ncbi:MAG: hypothetical protein HQK66_08235 [Desulfamplus sp.]|nr:hypothetical protein [Desulfamplus sp.]
MEEKQSRLITGLATEQPDALAVQMGLWHHLTLRNIIQRKFTGWVMQKDHLGNFLDGKFKSAAKIDALELRKWKLNEMLEFCSISLEAPLDSKKLNEAGGFIEEKSILCLKKVDSGFQGDSLDEMTRYILTKILEGAAQGFRARDEIDRRADVDRIVDVLKNMPWDQQEELKQLMGMDIFSPDQLQSAIYDHTLSRAIVTLITMGKYTAYLAAAKIVVALSGVASFYLARPLMKSLIPIVLFLTHPVAVSTVGVGLTWLTDRYANKEIRSFLLPVMVTGSFLSFIENGGAGVLENGKAGVFENGEAGILEKGKADVLEKGGAGVLENGKAGVFENGEAGVLEKGKAGVLENTRELIEYYNLGSDLK